MFEKAVATYLNKDVLRIYVKYPTFWKNKNRETAFYQNIKEITSHANAYEATAIMLYYRSLRGKDPVRMFQAIAIEVIEHYGYGILQSQYLAWWYFIVVALTEYDIKKGITDQTDITGMYQCYLNTGEIDYEQDWTN